MFFLISTRSLLFDFKKRLMLLENFISANDTRNITKNGATLYMCPGTIPISDGSIPGYEAW